LRRYAQKCREAWKVGREFLPEQVFENLRRRIDEIAAGEAE
jgi:hypothetical protein